jgi:hypothetical protein
MPVDLSELKMYNLHSNKVHQGLTIMLIPNFTGALRSAFNKFPELMERGCVIDTHKSLSTGFKLTDYKKDWEISGYRNHCLL